MILREKKVLEFSVGPLVEYQKKKKTNFQKLLLKHHTGEFAQKRNNFINTDERFHDYRFTRLLFFGNLRWCKPMMIKN